MKEITITIISMKKNKNDIKLLPGILEKVISKKSKQTTFSDEPVSEKFAHIKNIDDFLKDINLQERFKSIMSYGYDLRKNHVFTHSTKENNYETITLLERLEIIHVEWERFNNQKHREIGNRLITFSFYGDTVLEILDRINGKNSIITKRTLRIIAQHAKDMDLGDYFIELLLSSGVPESLIDYSISNDDSGVTYNTLLYFSSSSKKSDRRILFEIIEKLSSPYVCGGDKKATEVQSIFGSLLQHDEYCFENGKIKKATDDLLKKINEERIIAETGKKHTIDKQSLSEPDDKNIGKEELVSITIVTPQYGKFNFLWIVFNDDHKKKIKMNVVNKQTPSDVSYGKKLYDLKKSQTQDIDLDKSLMDHLNYSIWNSKILNRFKKRKILKQENKRTRLAEGIRLEVAPIQFLDENTRKHYPSL